MSEELGLGEVKRRIERLESEKASGESLELITEGLARRVERLENSQIWVNRTLIVMMLGIIVSVFKDFM